MEGRRRGRGGGGHHVVLEKLIPAVINSSVFTYLDVNKHFILHVDGSSNGLSFALYQQQQQQLRVLLSTDEIRAILSPVKNQNYQEEVRVAAVAVTKQPETDSREVFSGTCVIGIFKNQIQ